MPTLPPEQHPAIMRRPEDKDTLRKADSVTLHYGQDDGYEALALVLALAYEQAKDGKGNDRHAAGRPFDKQPICSIPRGMSPLAGAGGLAYQVQKKTGEALRMIENGAPHRARFEVLGAINYLAALHLFITSFED